jgi:MSHA pilin protein MshA
MKKQQGFTLIELIIVIVILGILAVTAAPRFIDIQSDARKETMQGVKAAIQGASQLVYAKSAIAGVQKSAAGTVTISGDTVNTAFGYPDADIMDTAAEVNRFVDIDLSAGADFQFSKVAAGDDAFRIGYVLTLTDPGDANSACYIEYVNAASAGATPTFNTVDGEC